MLIFPILNLDILCMTSFSWNNQFLYWHLGLKEIADDVVIECVSLPAHGEYRFHGSCVCLGPIDSQFFFFFFACWYHAMSIQFYYYYSSSSTFRYTCDCTFGVWLLVRLWRASTITHLIFMRCIEWPTCGDMYLQSLYACTHTAYDRNRFIQQIIQNQI